MKKEIKGFFAGVLIVIIVFTIILTVLAKPAEKSIVAAYKNIKIYVDGKEIQPKDAKGKKVEPFISEGTTYLPVRAVSEALGKEVTWDGDSSSVFVGENPGLSTEFKPVFEKDGWIYYVNSGKGRNLYRVKKDGSSNERVIAKDVSEACIYGEWIYYVEGGSLSPLNYKIYKMKTDGSAETKIIDGTWISSISISGGKIVYLDNVAKTLQYSEKKICVVDLNGNNKTIILEASDPDIMHAENGWIYYCDNSNQHIFRAKLDGSGVKEMNSVKSAQMRVSNGWIYYINTTDETINKMKLDGSNKVVISKNIAPNLFVNDSSVFYQEYDSNLYKLTDDGKSVLLAKKVRTIWGITSDWIFFIDNDEILKKVRTDGSKEQAVN